MNPKCLVVICVILGMSCARGAVGWEQLKIANNGKSTFTIVVPVGAPTSVQRAAQELQKDIELATDAQLPIQNDEANVTGAFISLGSTGQAKSADISSEGMANESFRIVTRDGNLYIIGPDTPGNGWINADKEVAAYLSSTPDTTSGHWTKNNGNSSGTANGVYTFLEDYVGVRWLMPGEMGRDVPTKRTFAVKKINRRGTPRFSMRRLPFLDWYANADQFRRIRAWRIHQKLGGATNWNFFHNWWTTINKSLAGRETRDVTTDAVKKLYKEHPDWFAMAKNGERPYPEGHDAKLETTNPELVKWFAEQAIKTMKSSKRPIAYSLSPSDGYGWSQSPASKALYDSPPSFHPAFYNYKHTGIVSSLVLKWYHDVAQVVAKEYPQGHLTGFIYANFQDPATKYKAKLPKNFSPMIAPNSDYGYQLYRKKTQKYFHKVMDYWANIVTGDWFYYDLPNQLLFQGHSNDNDAQFPGTTGNITPVTPEILDVVFPQLLRSHINGVNIYGVPSWSNAALSNYVLAKMEWDPTLNAYDVEKEWLHRAYGPDAGAVMEQFYETLDSWFHDYYRQKKIARYTMGPKMLKGLYAEHYPAMEKLFLKAKSQKMTKLQQKRLQLIRDNLIVLQWRLRNLESLPPSFKSPLQRNDAQISALIARDNPGFPLFPGVTALSSSRDNPGPTPLPWKIRLSKSTLPAGKRTMPKWNAGQFLIYADQDSDIRITTQKVTRSAYFAAYEIKNQEGDMIKKGLFNTTTPIVFQAKSGQTYMLTIPLRKPVKFQVQVQNAAVASGYLQDSTLQLGSEKSAPAYVFHVPDKNPAVSVLEDSNGIKINKF